jgi:D-amino-acid dehydrogenase
MDQIQESEHNMDHHPEVLVIGGGAIGICTAYRLAKAGKRVVLLERDGIASGCSQANAGLIVPSHIIPLANISALGLGLRSLLHRDSPFRIRPQLDASLFAWFLKFWRACSSEQVNRGTHLLVDLTACSAELFSTWIAEENIDCHYHQRGWLMVYRTESGFIEGKHETHQLESHGIDLQVLDSHEACRMEGSLRPGFAGAIYYRDDAHLDPESFLLELANRFIELGGKIYANNEVLGFERSGDRLQTVHTSSASFHPEVIVLAAGAWTGELLRSLGLHLALQPAKGYSLTIPDYNRGPGIPLYLSEEKVAITPLGDRLRISGILDFTGMDLKIEPRRIRTILAAARTALDIPEDVAEYQPWSGLRPCSPDGLPFIGRTYRYPNLIVATGHAMLGITLAPVTAELVWRIIEGCDDEMIRTSLIPNRFN